jgi:hypothetical protein
MLPVCLQLHEICSHLRLSLWVFTIIKSNFNYFGHFFNSDAIIQKLHPIDWMTFKFIFIH